MQGQKLPSCLNDVDSQPQECPSHLCGAWVSQRSPSWLEGGQDAFRLRKESKRKPGAGALRKEVLSMDKADRVDQEFSCRVFLQKNAPSPLQLSCCLSTWEVGLPSPVPFATSPA